MTITMERVVRLRGLSLRWHLRAALSCGAMVLAALVAGVFAVGTGDYSIPVADVVKTLAGQGDQATTFIVETLRLPRALTALMVGAALGIGGAVIQSLSRNPLGSPDLIGFTTGSATGALVEILVLGGGTAAVATGSVAGAVLTALFIYLLAYRRGSSGYRLVLVGIGVGAALESVNAYLITRADPREAMGAAFWLTGSLNGRGWEHARPLAAALAVLLPVTLYLGRYLRMLEMGDDAAAALGVPVERARLALVVAGVALTAVAVAVAGPVPFIALAAPQLARRITGMPGPGLVAAGLLGATLLISADVAGQRLFAPTRLPVGVVTGALGGAYLLWLLAREGRRGRT